MNPYSYLQTNLVALNDPDLLTTGLNGNISFVLCISIGRAERLRETCPIGSAAICDTAV